MYRIRIVSTALSAASHDPQTQALELQFQNGTTYRYGNVPARVVRTFLATSSKGRYFNRYIRNRYPVQGCYFTERPRPSPQQCGSSASSNLNCSCSDCSMHDNL